MKQDLQLDLRNPLRSPHLPELNNGRQCIPRVDYKNSIQISKVKHKIGIKMVVLNLNRLSKCIEMTRSDKNKSRKKLKA